MAEKGATIDMSLYFGTPQQKQEFCTSLLDVLKKRGCVKVQNHGIPDEMVHELFEQVSCCPPRGGSTTLAHG